MIDKIVFIIVSVLLIVALAMAITCEVNCPAEEEGVTVDVEVPETTVIIEPTTVVQHTVYVDETDYTEPSVTQTEEQIIVDIPAETVRMCAKMLYGECRGAKTTAEKAACLWVALNRVDAGYGTLTEVITAKGQFTGYRKSNPVDEELVALARDVLIRWHMERAGLDNVGRVIPSDYLYFRQDTSGKNTNVFRTKYAATNCEYWDWSLPSPYEEDNE